MIIRNQILRHFAVIDLCFPADTVIDICFLEQHIPAKAFIGQNMPDAFLVP